LTGVDDARVWGAAQQEERFFITQDLDFSDLRRYAPGSHRGVLLVRLRDPGREALYLRVRSLFDGEHVENWVGCFGYHLRLHRSDIAADLSRRGLRFVANSMRFLRQLATMGLGVAVIDDAIARPAVVAGSLVRVLPEWSLPPVPVYALTPSKPLPARTRIFLETLSDHLRGKGLEEIRRG